jgi:leucyl aminopeptidase
LTGAVISALGHAAAGIWTNDEQITKDLLLAGNTSRDKVWHMPIF